MEPINSTNPISLSGSLPGSGKISEKSKIVSNGEDPEKLKQACQGFEAIFLSTMLKSMRNTLFGDSLFGKNQGMEVFESMHDRDLADQLAASGRGVGIAEFLEKQQYNQQD